jgi:membrane-associated phospholipid phosphatase
MDNQEVFLNYEIRTQTMWNVLRATPATYLFILIVFFLLKPSKLSLYLLISYGVLSLSSHVFKKTSDIFYELTVGKNNPIWLLGLGRRPDGATDCASFLKFDKKRPTSYGMPSGHSMTTWAVVTYLLCCLYEYNHLGLVSKDMDIMNNCIDNSSTGSNILGEFTNNVTINKVYTYLIVIILIIFAVMVSYSRVPIENCHTTQQVIVGGLLGIIMGGLIYFVQRKVFNIKTFY